jgi:hypothetical protein
MVATATPRRAWRAAAAVLLGPLLLLSFSLVDATPAPPAGAEAFEIPLQAEGLVDEGAGIYTDPSVAFQLSGFTINRRMVSCAVGTLAGPAPGQPGPFSMLMYSTKITSYEVDRGVAPRIVASGTMRSITRMGNQTNEDVEHSFVAIATDNGGIAPDSFVVHFVTPFWNHENPMATKSTVEAGWVQFGGSISTDAEGANAGDIVIRS